MGDFWDTPIPTLGEIGTSLKDKFGRVAGNLAGQAQAFTLAQKYGHGGFDAAPDNDPAASAVSPKAPRADIQSASSYLAPNASTDQVATTLRSKFGGPSGKGITPAIAEGAYQDQPGYGEFGSSGPRSLAQMLQDREAAAQLDASYGARQAANEQFAPHPQEDALRAKGLSAGYEDLMEAPRPLYSQGQTLGSFYKGNNGAYVNEGPGIRIGQQRAIDAAYAKQVAPEQERRGSYMRDVQQEEAAKQAALAAVRNDQSLSLADRTAKQQQIEGRAAERMQNLDKAYGIGARLNASELYK